MQIGTGLAGLTTAYLLSQQQHGYEVHVFEKADKIGVDAAAVEVTVSEEGKELDVSIDVPMRSIDAGPSLVPHKLRSRILSPATTAFNRNQCRGPTGRPDLCLLKYDGKHSVPDLQRPFRHSRVVRSLKIILVGVL